MARTWLDVEVKHRQRTREGGVDCINLVIEVGVEADVLDRPPPGSPGDELLKDYGRLPNPKRLIAGLEAHMLQLHKDDVGPGDVVALSWGARDIPMHTAIFAEYKGRTTMILAYPLLRLEIGDRTRPRVREFTYGSDWPDRACSWWRYPRLAV